MKKKQKKDWVSLNKYSFNLRRSLKSLKLDSHDITSMAIWYLNFTKTYHNKYYETTGKICSDKNWPNIFTLKTVMLKTTSLIDQPILTK